MKSLFWRIEAAILTLCTLSALLWYQPLQSWPAALGCSCVIYILLLWWRAIQIRRWLSSEQITQAPYLSTTIIHFLGIQKNSSRIRATHDDDTTTDRLHQTLEALPSATVILDQHNTIEWGNYAALPLLGINAQRDIGVPIENLLRQRELIEHLHDSSRKHSEIPSPVAPELTLSIQIVSASKGKKLLLAHNITPHIAVQQARKKFIANASHELRTPLTVVSGYLEFMQSTESLPEELHKPVTKAREQAASMELLINDLLILSHLENKELSSDEITLIDIDLHLNSIIQTLHDSGKGHAHNITHMVDTNLSIYANEKELNSMCYNLINNAIKYSERGSDITIQWQCHTDNHVMFSVTDTGIGIAPEHINHLTERFYRVDSGRSRRVGGTGLGLSIVKHSIERHNGHLEIHSTLGKGSTFSIILPHHPMPHLINTMT